MAPVVHGLEEEYAGRVDFVYLNVAEERSAEAKRTYGFATTPHFFLLRADGSPITNVQGVVPADSLRSAIDALLEGAPERPAR
jgi:thioredoxin-like negative regulator of GroEL